MIWFHRVRYWLRSFGLRGRFLFRRNAVEDDLSEELAYHLELETDQNVRAGMDPREARRLAALAFGGVERFKAQVRESRGVQPMEDLFQDLRLSGRQLRNTPLFTLTAILTLALGIGANAGAFSVINGALLKDRPYQDVHQLVHIYSSEERISLYGTSFAQDLEDLQALTDVFQDVGGFRGEASRIMEIDGARMVLVEAVSANLLPLLGVEAAHGRFFALAESGPSASAPVAVLGYSFWEEKYGMDPGVLGKTIKLAGIPYTIIGVAPSSFESLTAQGFHTALFVPISMSASLASEEHGETPASQRGAMGLKAIGRLREGVSLEQAQDRVDALSSGLRESFPDLYGTRSFLLYPSAGVALQPDIDGFLKGAAGLLFLAVGLVLLMACTNLASTILARGMDRKQEIALRLALGAQRSRLVRQLLTESLLLGFLGSAVGLLLARWILHLLTASIPQSSLPFRLDTGLDTSVLLFTMAVTGMAIVLVGLAPALQSTKADLAASLKTGMDSRSNGRPLLRNGLVGFQIAVSTVLLVGGGLFLRSFREAQLSDPGFETRAGALVWVDLDVSGVPREEWPSTTDELIRKAREVPGMERVAASNSFPLSEGAWNAEFDIPGIEPPEWMDHHQVLFFSIDHEFLPTLHIPILQGRGITQADREGTQLSVVISEGAARKFWPGESVLGKEIRPAGGDQTFRVVGVAADIHAVNLHQAADPVFFFPRTQFTRGTSQLWLVARGNEQNPGHLAALTQMVRGHDPDLVIVAAKTMDDQIQGALFLPRLLALLLGSFGTLALALAAIGLYGIVDYSVARRTKELGIRLSLGANASTVRRLVIGSVMSLVAGGCSFGLLMALGVTHFLSGYLRGVSVYDPLTLLAVPVLLGLVALAAAYPPAMKASHVNPMKALRSE